MDDQEMHVAFMQEREAEAEREFLELYNNPEHIEYEMQVDWE